MSFHSENKTTDGFLIGNSFLFASPQAEPEPQSSIAEAEPSTEAPLDESTIGVSIPSEVEAAGSFLFASGHNHDGHVHDHAQDQSDHSMSENSSDIDSMPAIDVLESEITIDDGSSHAKTTTEAILIESIEISSVVDVKIPSMPADPLETEIAIGNGQDYEYTETVALAADVVAEKEPMSISSVVDVKIPSMPADLLEAEIAIANERPTLPRVHHQRLRQLVAQLLGRRDPPLRADVDDSCDAGHQHERSRDGEGAPPSGL